MNASSSLSKSRALLGAPAAPRADAPRSEFHRGRKEEDEEEAPPPRGPEPPRERIALLLLLLLPPKLSVARRLSRPTRLERDLPPPGGNEERGPRVRSYGEKCDRPADLSGCMRPSSPNVGVTPSPPDCRLPPIPSADRTHVGMVNSYWTPID